MQICQRLPERNPVLPLESVHCRFFYQILAIISYGSKKFYGPQEKRLKSVYRSYWLMWFFLRTIEFISELYVFVPFRLFILFCNSGEVWTKCRIAGKAQKYPEDICHLFSKMLVGVKKKNKLQYMPVEYTIGSNHVM